MEDEPQKQYAYCCQTKLSTFGLSPTYAVRDGALVEVQAIGPIERALQHVVHHPEGRTECLESVN